MSCAVILTFLHFFCLLGSLLLSAHQPETTQPSVLMLGQAKGGMSTRVEGLVSEKQHTANVFLSLVRPPSATLLVCLMSWHPHLGSNKQQPKTEIWQLCDVRTRCFFCALMCNPFSRNPKGQTRCTASGTAKMFFFVILLLNMLKKLFSTFVHSRIIIPMELLTFLNICTFPQRNVNLLLMQLKWLEKPFHRAIN